MSAPPGTLVVMPWPRQIETREAGATAQPEDNTFVGGASARVEHLFSRLPPIGLSLRCTVEAPPKPVPALADSYAYTLTRAGRSVHLEADTEWGALAGLATIAQLGPAVASIREVRDAPRFPWRGLMIDTVRHFITLATLKRTVDAMWFYKLNVLHLHLTDDQGFRFRSHRYPELASADAYAPAELADLVTYAADRGVRVVPELDVPGHTTSWLAARPQWGFGERPVAAPSRRFGVHKTCIDPANPAVLTAVETLLAELAEVFPDEHLHLGGDEAVALDRGIQATFMADVVGKATAFGKRPFGWDECLHPQLPRHTVIQAWRSLAARDAALAAGFDCVVSAPYYLDLFYPADAHAVAPDAKAEPALAADNPRLRHVRAAIAGADDTFRHAQPALPPATPGQLLGGEACLWTELVTDDLVDARVWSRMPMIAEQLWHGSAAPDTYARLARSRRTLATLGIVAEDDAFLTRYPAELRPLLQMLEPVKWYRRLLGERVLTERTAGVDESAATRPYDVATPLTRPVDWLPPESLASRRAEAELAAGKPMAHWTAGWRQQRDALRQHPDLEAELGAAASALAKVAAIVDGTTDAGTPEHVAALAGPFGEYLLPIAYAVASHVDANAAG